MPIGPFPGLELPNTAWPAGIHPLSLCRNGVVPDAISANTIASYANMLASRRMKVLADYFVLPNSATDTTTNTVVCRTLAHTSPNASTVTAEYVLAPPNVTDTSTLTPSVYWTIDAADVTTDPVTLAGPTTVASVTLNGGRNGTVNPQDYIYMQAQFGVEPDATYAFELHTSDRARVISAVLYEQPRLTLDNASDVSVPSGTLYYDAPIYDAPLGALNSLQISMHKRGGASLLRWANQLAVIRTANTYANLLDQTVTAWSANSPGWYVWPQYRGTLANTDVTCKAWWYGRSSTTDQTVYLKFIRTGADIHEFFTASASNGYHCATVSLPGTVSSDKVDVLIKGAGVQIADISVSALGIYEYIA